MKSMLRKSSLIVFFFLLTKLTFSQLGDGKIGVKLASATTQSIHTGFNYDFQQNILGYNLGYWIKPSRLGLTYGGNLIFRSDFSQNRVGFAPVIGYKLFGFHLQTGYNFLTHSNSFKNTNTFFVSLRFILINQRDIKIDR